MSIVSVVDMADGELVVYIPDRARGRGYAKLMKLSELRKEIEYYRPDVIPITREKGATQIPIYIV